MSIQLIPLYIARKHPRHSSRCPAAALPHGLGLACRSLSLTAIAFEIFRRRDSERFALHSNIL